MSAPTTPPAGLTRRTLLGGLGAAAALAACGRSEDPTSAPSISPSVAPPPGQEDLVGAALEAAGVDAPLRLTPILFVPQLLTGTDRHLQFGVVDIEQKGRPNLQLDVWLVDQSGNVATGPIQPTFFPREGLAPTGGLYHALVSIEAAGTYDMVIATRDGAIAGAGVLQLVTSSLATPVGPGQTFPAVPTPTVTKPLDVADICTREPECEMHEISLDTALQSGRPTVVTLTSPTYCATSTCGPALDGVQQAFDMLHQQHHDRYGGHDDGIQWLSGPNFIHVETFADNGKTPTALARQLQVGGEPWTWIIGADGVVLDRIGGPIVAEILAARVLQLCPETNCVDPAEASESPSAPSQDGPPPAGDAPSEQASGA